MSAVRTYENSERPDGWRLVRLGELVGMNQGGTPRKEDPEYWDGSIPFLTGADLTDFRVGRQHARSFLTDAGLVSGHTAVCEAGTLLLATRTRVGLAGIATELMGASQDITCLYPNEQIDSEFLCRTLLRLAPELQRLSRGTTIQGITREDVCSVPVLIPPLSEQRAIADVLDSIDEVIERTEAVITATETLRNSLLHELLTRGVPGWHTEWKGVPGVGTIPADWEVVRLGEVIETSTYGTNEPLGDNGNIVVLRMNNIRRGEIDWSDVKRAELSEKELNELDLQPGDILFNRTNSLDLVGKIAMIRDLPEPTSFASYLVRIRTKAERALPIWSSALLGSNGYQSRIRRFATPGVSQANINPTSLKSLTIPLPSISEQANVIAVLDGIREQMQHARHERDSLGQAKSAIADALLSGRMRGCKIAH